MSRRSVRQRQRGAHEPEWLRDAKYYVTEQRDREHCFGIKQFRGKAQANDDSTLDDVSGNDTTVAAEDDIQKDDQDVLFANQKDDQVLLSANPNWFINYKIPWAHFPKKFTEVCDKGEVPEEPVKNEMVRILMDNITSVCEKPKRGQLKSVVVRILQKYPQLSTTLNDVIIGDGTSSLLAKLETRRDNLGRLQRKSPKRSSVEPPKKKAKKDEYGCLEHQVAPPLPENETVRTQEAKRLKLKEHFDELTFNNDFVDKTMDATYSSQRTLIGEGKSVQETLSEWPFLADERWLFQHFQTLTGIEIESIRKSLKSRAIRIHSYFKAQRTKSQRMKEVLGTIAKGVNKLETNQPILNGLPYLLAAYFKEDITALIKCYEDPTRYEEVEKDKDTPLTPFLAVVGDVNNIKGAGLYLLCDKMTMNATMVSFIDGLLCTFCTFFVFGIVYPPEVSATLDFIQRYPIRLNPPLGTKVQKDKKNGMLVSNRVVALANQLSEFESDWVLEEE